VGRENEVVGVELDQRFPDGDSTDTESRGELGFAEWLEWREEAVEDLASEFLEDLSREKRLDDGSEREIGHFHVYTVYICGVNVDVGFPRR
jgi:hypothetical protein